MTVKAAFEVTGVAVLIPESGIKSSVTSLYKLLFATPQPHSMLKYTVIAFVTHNAAGGSVRAGSRITGTPPLTMAGSTDQSLMSRRNFEATG
jgi:hypothetical protein